MESFRYWNPACHEGAAVGWRSSAVELVQGRSSNTNLLCAAQVWAITGALFLLVGAEFVLQEVGLALRFFGLFVLALGAKALRAGVELQFGGEPAGQKRLVRLLLLTASVVVMLEVARVMGSWQ